LRWDNTGLNRLSHQPFENASPSIVLQTQLKVVDNYGNNDHSKENKSRYFFRVCYNKGFGHHHLCFVESQNQAREGRSLAVGQSGLLVCFPGKWLAWGKWELEAGQLCHGLGSVIVSQGCRNKHKQGDIKHTAFPRSSGG
jgi:hypothetical protein